MKTNTIGVLSKLEGASLFTAVGNKDVSDYAYASSWMDAMANCVGAKWSDTLIDSTSTLREKVLALSRERYDEWRVMDGQFRPLVLDLARKKTARLMQAHSLPDKFMFAVFASWLGIGYEAEYSDLVEPGFYTHVILDCYMKGHFPCGWDGDFPEGRLIVY